MRTVHNLFKRLGRVCETKQTARRGAPVRGLSPRAPQLPAPAVLEPRRRAPAAEASGLLLALGFFTPFAALAVASVMVVAVGSVHWKNGFWSTEGGYEYNLLVWTVAVALAATGPGRFSLDHAFGWADNLSGLWWRLDVAVVSLAGGLLVARAARSAARAGSARRGAHPRSRAGTCYELEVRITSHP